LAAAISGSFNIHKKNNFHATASGHGIQHPETARESTACFKQLTKYQPVLKSACS
jgi:hypothetical protein